MKIKKSEKYETECKEIETKILDILKLDNEYSFLLYDLDKNLEQQNKILELIPDIKRYYASSFWNGINNKETKRPYLTIIRNTLKRQGYLFINKNLNIKLDNGEKVRTTKYFIVKPN